MPASPRLVIVAPSWIGDMVMAQSLFIALRDRLPEATIDVLAPPVTASLTARMPEVDTVLTCDIRHGELAIGKRRSVARRLAKRGYDKAIILQRSAKAALIPWMAGIGQRTGERGEARFGLINDVRVIDKQRYPLKAEHYALLGLASGDDALPPITYPRLRIDPANQAALIARFQLDTTRPVVGFAPGAAFGAAKAWPVYHYARLAGALDARGIACWVFGSAADRALADAMQAAAPRHGVDLTEKTALTDIIDLAACTDQFVGNDTGVMHLASAAATRVIALYGSTDPDYAPPLAPVAQRLWRGLDCSPCRERECPLGHHACLEDLAVTDVLTACLEPGSPAIASLHGVHGLSAVGQEHIATRVP